MTDKKTETFYTVDYKTNYSSADYSVTIPAGSIVTADIVNAYYADVKYSLDSSSLEECRCYYAVEGNPTFTVGGGN